MRFLGSLTRIADLADVPWQAQRLDRAAWANGDYVEAEVVGKASTLYHVEDARGAMLDIAAGDRLVGALGRRAATLEGVGSWEDVTGDVMHCLTSAGLLGAFTSLSGAMARPVELRYRGHCLRGGTKVTIRDFALSGDGPAFAVPTVLLVGTSMSAGKTTTGRLVCELLAGQGWHVIGAKLTGAGRYRDILSFREAGAAEVYDFVDAGLPSTVVPEPEFRSCTRALLRHIAGRSPDVLVAEAGASPLEPYNGAAAIDELGASVRCTILCASDPYGVLGVQHAFGLVPDLVAGPAASTSAAIELVGRLSGAPALDLTSTAARGPLQERLARCLAE